LIALSRLRTANAVQSGILRLVCSSKRHFLARCQFIRPPETLLRCDHPRRDGDDSRLILPVKAAALPRNAADRRSIQRIGAAIEVERRKAAALPSKAEDSGKPCENALSQMTLKHTFLIFRKGGLISMKSVNRDLTVKPCRIGADERTRTFTPIKEQRPQRCASTNSATSAHWIRLGWALSSVRFRQ
jgi:hypothetical protein